VIPLALLLIASIGGDARPFADPTAPAQATSAPSPNNGLLWRSAAVAGGALCGMTACGAAPVAGGALALSTTLRNVDPLAGYAIGLCCGAAMIPLPGLCGGLFALGAGVGGEWLSGLSIDWSSLGWSAGAVGMIGTGVGALAFVIAFSAGLVLNEAGQRALANVTYVGVPLVVISGGALLASAAAGGLYFLSRTTPDETVIDANAWASAR